MLNISEIIKATSLKVKFQHIVSHHKEFPKSVEAFVSGIDPVDGSEINPLALIEAAKEEGLLEALNRAMIATVLAAFHKIYQTEQEVLLYVNVHGSLISTPDKSIAWVKEALNAYGMSSDSVIFDIADYPDVSVAQIRAFIQVARENGFYISLDDIGKTYFNLDRIMAYNPDIIKVNQQYLEKLDHIDYARRLKKQTSYIAHDMGIIVVFTGIETEAALAEAFKLGGQYFQGYYISEPEVLSAANVTAFLDNATINSLLKDYIKEVHVDGVREIMNRMLVDIRAIQEESKTFGESQEEEGFRELFHRYPYIQNAWVVDMDGKQVTKAKVNNESFIKKNGQIFKLFDIGHDYSDRQFYQVIRSGSLDVWITKPYASLLNNKLCFSTASTITIDTGEQYILCLEVDYQHFNTTQQSN